MNYDLENMLSDPELSDSAKALGTKVSEYLITNLPPFKNFSDTMEYLMDLESDLEVLEDENEELKNLVKTLLKTVKQADILIEELK